MRQRISEPYHQSKWSESQCKEACLFLCNHSQNSINLSNPTDCDSTLGQVQPRVQPFPSRHGIAERHYLPVSELAACGFGRCGSTKRRKIYQSRSTHQSHIVQEIVDHFYGPSEGVLALMPLWVTQSGT